VGDAPDGIAAGHGAIWVSTRADNAVVRLDPDSLQVGTSIRVGAGPRGIVADDTGVWVADSLGGTVAHIDPSTGEMDRQLPVGDTPTSIVSGAGSVWVSDAGDNTIARIDPVAPRVQERMSVGSSPRGLGIGGGALWVAAQPGRSPAHVGGTLRVAYPDGLTTIDPALDYDSEGWQAMHYVYDGLVGLNRGGGSSNYEVVPDLARALPTVSPDGTTYTFTLRTGIRYSDGTPLRASDILRGVRRVLTVRGEQPVNYYEGIVGAQHCVQAPTTCDLSMGVVPRDDAGTVTFHLTAPDADFLYKLTIFVVATPPGAPDRDFGTDAFPGTGPYQVGSFVKNSTLTLIRNPQFRQWSSAAQPAGYPDVLTWVSADSQTAATDAVARGVDDVAYPSGADAVRLTRTLPTQVLTLSAPQSYFIVLAGDSPPFNNTLARQAVAMAIDRRSIAPLAARGLPQCRLVPPSYPGYSSGCPYQYDPERAKVLAAQSGTTRYPVHIYIGKDQQTRNFFDAFLVVQRTIAGLGYRTTLTPLPFEAYNSVVANKSSHVNAYGRAWIADYPSPAQFYEVLSCAATGTNSIRHCDQVLDRMAARAVAQQATDPAAAGREWKALYQQVDKDAYIITTSGGIVSYLMSARVGNAYVEGFLNEPEYDQMWVR
jgi:peptide/nickel transport system substrate-binding protein